MYLARMERATREVSSVCVRAGHGEITREGATTGGKRVSDIDMNVFICTRCKESVDQIYESKEVGICIMCMEHAEAHKVYDWEDQ